MSEGLLRQRRNLISLCVLLWIIRFGEVTFNKLSFSGIDISFNNPNALVAAIWLAFFYFLFRYYQYFSTEGVSTLSTGLRDAMEEKCRSKIKSIIENPFPDHNTAIPYSFSLIKSCNWTYNGQCFFRDKNENIVSNSNFKIFISPAQLLVPFLLSIGEITLRKSLITDYLLPFFLSIYVIWYCGRSDWYGSFLSLLLS